LRKPPPTPLPLGVLLVDVAGGGPPPSGVVALCDGVDPSIVYAQSVVDDRGVATFQYVEGKFSVAFEGLRAEGTIVVGMTTTVLLLR
jgi:hypothetical protein